MILVMIMIMIMVVTSRMMTMMVIMITVVTLIVVMLMMTKVHYMSWRGTGRKKRDRTHFALAQQTWRNDYIKCHGQTESE